MARKTSAIPAKQLMKVRRAVDTCSSLWLKDMVSPEITNMSTATEIMIGSTSSSCESCQNS
jgi:hypothetical protein